MSCFKTTFPLSIASGSRFFLSTWRLSVVAACGLLVGCGPAESKLPPEPPVDTHLCSTSVSSGPVITIDFATEMGNLRSFQGFLNGISPVPGNTDQFDETLVSDLKPAFWRFGTGANVIFPKIQKFGAVVTFVVSDGLADAAGGYSKVQPWTDWVAHEKQISDMAKGNLMSGRPIRYFDVWGEPQGGTKFLGTYDQLLELFSRTFKIIKGIDPEAKVIGPSFDDFLGNFAGHDMGAFITDLDKIHGVRLDAISWHELGAQPMEEIPAHVKAMRDGLATLFPGYAPEIHINEYSNGVQHLLPGFTVGYLHYFTRANVDVANRACWNVGDEGWSDCWAGLDGLLRQDNRTPTHTYWVHRFYADLVGKPQLSLSTTDPRAVGIAVRSGPDRIRVLTGRATSAPPAAATSLTLTLKGLPAAAKTISVAGRYIGSQSIPGPLASPADIPSCSVSVTNGEAQIPLETYPDGAAIDFDLTLL